MSRLSPALVLFPALLSLSALLGCTKDDVEPEDTAPEEVEKDPVLLDCVLPAVETPITDGMWSVGIDEALFNHCENEVGKGLHIHVGEPTMLQIDASNYPELSAISDPQSEQSMPMTGSQDGANFELVGNVEFGIGTCIIGIEATLTGQMTGQDSFCYQMDATASIAEELSPDACSLILGETENHTFSELPCDQAWIGVAAPAPQ
jgi:hypothetical protein